MLPGVQRRGNAAYGLKPSLSFVRGRGKAAYGFKLPLSLWLWIRSWYMDCNLPDSLRLTFGPVSWCLVYKGGVTLPMDWSFPCPLHEGEVKLHMDLSFPCPFDCELGVCLQALILLTVWPSPLGRRCARWGRVSCITVLVAKHRWKVRLMKILLHLMLGGRGRGKAV